MAKETKELNHAERTIKRLRMHYPCLYPTDMHLFLCMISCSDWAWVTKDDGFAVLENSYDEKVEAIRKTPTQPGLTEDGWESAKNNTRVPTTWNVPSNISGSAIFNIPDNAHECWLQEISMFIYSIEKLSKMSSVVLDYITAHFRLCGYVEHATTGYITSSWEGFSRLVVTLDEKKTYERVTFIRNERYAAKAPKQPEPVLIGSSVRHQLGTGDVHAKVLEIIETEINGNRIKLARLSTPIPYPLLPVSDLVVVHPDLAEFVKQSTM
jgi:hypothetical protein